MFQIPVLLALAAGLIAGATLNVIALRRAQHQSRTARRELRAAHRRERRLHHALDQAHTRARSDDLTGLPNRRAFAEHLADIRRHDQPITVAMLDLNDFKTVNDTLGHDAGDELLVGVADRLADLPPPVRLAARLQGDEFVLVIDGDLGDGVRAALGALHAITDTPLAVANTHAVLTASAGVAAAHPDLSDAQLLHNADVAMYDAKRAGGGVLSHTTASSNSQVQHRPGTRHRDRHRDPRRDPAPRLDSRGDDSSAHQPRH
jgi:diguanylate cyclase (GGDEF)-like protein